MDNFAGMAARLAGAASLLLGWRPDEFWRATPAELTTILACLAGDEPQPPAPLDIRQLMEMFPDG